MAPPAESSLFSSRRGLVRLPDSLRAPPYAVANKDLRNLTSATEALLQSVASIYDTDDEEDVEGILHGCATL